MTHTLFSQKTRRISPGLIVFLWFGAFVLLGTALLLLPAAHRPGGPEVDFVAALFTSVSAACVAGFSVVPLHDTFSMFGQCVILFLIELGGIGIMTLASFGLRLLGRRLSFTQHTAAADAIYQNDAATEFKRTFAQILRIAMAIQFIGAIVIGLTLIPEHWPKGEYALWAWSSVFHSVSAFCNCGFSIYPGDFMAVRDNTPFLAVILVLVLLGNVGHLVLNELYMLPAHIRSNPKRPFRISLHSRVVLTTTAAIVVIGTVALLLLDAGNPGGLTFWEAAFMTVSGRTVGFTITNPSTLPLSSLIIVMFLMFVGGSPGSCAGGVKTTSLAIWAARIRGAVQNNQTPTLFGFTIIPELVNRARALIAVATVWNAAGIFILSVIHPEEDFRTLLFEQISAFGTIGMTLDFTPHLNTLGRLWVVFSMLVGKLGLLSIVFYMHRKPRVSINRPYGKIMVG